MGMYVGQAQGQVTGVIAVSVSVSEGGEEEEEERRRSACVQVVCLAGWCGVVWCGGVMAVWVGGLSPSFLKDRSGAHCHIMACCFLPSTPLYLHMSTCDTTVLSYPVLLSCSHPVILLSCYAHTQVKSGLFLLLLRRYDTDSSCVRGCH